MEPVVDVRLGVVVGRVFPLLLVPVKGISVDEVCVCDRHIGWHLSRGLGIRNEPGSIISKFQHLRISRWICRCKVADSTINREGKCCCAVGCREHINEVACSVVSELRFDSDDVGYFDETATWIV